MTVPGTDGRKMSKSYGNTIPILADPDAIRAAVMSIVTDSRPADEPKDPHQDLVFRLYQLIAPPEEVAGLAERYRAGGFRYVDVKGQLADALIDRFKDARPSYQDLIRDPAELERVLKASAERARIAAAEVVGQAKAATGIGQAA